MNISKAFKFRLITNKEQDLSFSKWAGSCRFVYNWGLAERKKSWESEIKHLSYVYQASLLKNLKKDEGTSFLKEVPAQLLQQALRDLDQAYKNFFSRLKKGQVGKNAGFPRFKKKGRSVDSFRFPDPSQFEVKKISKKKSMLDLPKIGKLKFLSSREIMGRVRNCTISREGKYWFVSFNCELEHESPENKGTAIGIDRGIVTNLVTSENKKYELPVDKIKKLEKRIAVLQKRDKGKKKFSKNWTRSIRKVAQIHRKITKIRHDFLHKASTDIAKKHSYVVLEDLNIKNMSKSASGTLEEPGKNVAQKSGLNRSLLRQGWFSFQILLEYKALWYGSYVDYVDPKNTSRKCSNPECGYIEKANRQTQDLFACQKCGLELNADLNAARIILTRGHRGCACGDANISWIDEARTTSYAQV
jgi:putative transposase